MFQSIQLIGHLGKEVTMRYTKEGKAVADFTLAVNAGFGDSKQTMWVKITAWEKTAENCNQYLKKGSKVFIYGRLAFDAETGGPKMWTGKDDGKTHSSFEITADRIVFLDAKGDKATEAKPAEDVSF
jgi:single-strand DNA-binding protein